MSPEAPASLAIFARAPGRAKSRLVPALGRERASRLALAFLEDTVARVEALAGLFEAALWAASEEDAADLAETFGARLPICVQPDGDLGERMRAALDAGLTRSSRALVIGSDAPTLPAKLLREAASVEDVVLGPSCDGGYYLLGVRARSFALGPAVRFSTPHALGDTLALARDRSVRLLSPWYDVDTEEDLRLLRAHLGARPSAAPATALALSGF